MSEEYPALVMSWPGGPAATPCCGYVYSGVYRRELAEVEPGGLAAVGRAALADGAPRTLAELEQAAGRHWPAE